MPLSLLLRLAVVVGVLGLAQAFGTGVSARPFGVRKGKDESPKLILISGKFRQPTECVMPHHPNSPLFLRLKGHRVRASRPLACRSLWIKTF